MLRWNHFNAPKINLSFTSGCQQHVYSLSQLNVLLIASSQPLFIHVCFRKKITKTKNNNDVTLLKSCTNLYTTQGDDTHTRTKPKTLLPFMVVVAVQNEEEDQREKKRERKTRLVQYL